MSIGKIKLTIDNGTGLRATLDLLRKQGIVFDIDVPARGRIRDNIITEVARAFKADERIQIEPTKYFNLDMADREIKDVVRSANKTPSIGVAGSYVITVQMADGSFDTASVSIDEVRAISGQAGRGRASQNSILMAAVISKGEDWPGDVQVVSIGQTMKMTIADVRKASDAFEPEKDGPDMDAINAAIDQMTPEQQAAELAEAAAVVEEMTAEQPVKPKPRRRKATV